MAAQVSTGGGAWLKIGCDQSAGAGVVGEVGQNPNLCKEQEVSGGLALVRRMREVSPWVLGYRLE